MSTVSVSPFLLNTVQKPARYIGGEYNSIVKDHRQMAVSVALAFPDVYEVAMSHLGLKILYEVINRQEDAVAERVYAPWPDMEAAMRQSGLPLYTLETKTPVKEYDVFGFTLQYEMSCTNVLNMLDLAGLPIWSEERTDDMPLVVAGGPCVYNPEPLAPFIDVFFVGESEESVVELVDAVKAWKAAGRPDGRRGLLERMAQISGNYVPAFYDAHYDRAGNFARLVPNTTAAPAKVRKRVVENVDALPVPLHPILPHIESVHDRAVLELFRGCTRGCRFCQAGMIYRPVREKTQEQLLAIARELIKNSGYDEISLMSLSSADYSQLASLVDALFAEFADRGVSISLPSLRIDSFSVDIAKKVQQVRKSGLTLAPEAGTQRLRDVINKGVTEEDLMQACTNAFTSGWNRVKLYFMLGLPTETDEDLAGIAELGYRVSDLYRSITGRMNAHVTISVSSFVPKPFTPFQWFGQIPKTEIERRQLYLKSQIKSRNIHYRYHDAPTSLLEAVLARGDRRVAQVIYAAWKQGAKFDGWTDWFKPEYWDKAFQETGIDSRYYAERQRDFNEPLPWDHIDCGVTKDFLHREWRQGVNAALTHDCRRLSCAGCGVCPQLGVSVLDGMEGNRAKTTFIYRER
ncbi:MAG: TIGR03960 family B12-binding radical SAM protein [Negativicoccus succinicivorans]|uniref:TIGR03960 family B12-binding radical SAM protein n=1 Tax=Negativicoccus succinicivorans TaxID=620903 RepID=UPI00290F764C|nr:TIGR03960 family B12-binding radical SAM protein [Negativicoccus succinicivorans]MDU5914549.1 TIGR03960 family B12-binding radical SAM protein [Negativicoccus succinicivorans]